MVEPQSPCALGRQFKRERARGANSPPHCRFRGLVEKQLPAVDMIPDYGIAVRPGKSDGKCLEDAAKCVFQRFHESAFFIRADGMFENVGSAGLRPEASAGEPVFETVAVVTGWLALPQPENVSKAKDHRHDRDCK